MKVYVQLLYILLCAFYGNYCVCICNNTNYLSAFIPIREFLYVVNVFILMMLLKYLKMGE